MQVFSNKLPEEAVVLTFNFSPDLGSLTLTGTPTITVSVAQGSDPTPSAILNGTPQMDSTQTQWLVPVKAGIGGVSYLIAVLTNTTQTDTILELQAILPVSY